MEDVRRAYWAALEQGDRYAALEAVRQLPERGWTPMRTVEELVLPAQARVVEQWLDGAWSAEQERTAAGINEGIVHWLCSFGPAPPDDAPLVVVAGLDGDRHGLGAVVLAEGLAAAGHRVLPVTAGADDLLRAVLTEKPRAVVVDAALTSSLARHRGVLQSLRAVGIPVVAGGPAFAGDERRATALGAAAHADGVEEVVRVLGRLPARLPAVAPGEPGPAELEARWILEYHAEITPYVVRALAARLGVGGDPGGEQSRQGADGGPSVPAWWRELPGFVDHLLGCLASSLVTGDETIMAEVRDWLTRVLCARGGDAALVAEVWRLVAEPLRGHPFARLHLAGAQLPAEVPDEGPGEVPGGWAPRPGVR